MWELVMRIGSALSALNKLTPIWKSNLDVPIKREFFRATAESVLPIAHRLGNCQNH